MKRMIAVLTGLMLASAAHAAELTLISGGAVEPGVHAAVHAFEKATGHKVKVTFNTTPQMQKRISAGDTFDVVIIHQVLHFLDDSARALREAADLLRGAREVWVHGVRTHVPAVKAAAVVDLDTLNRAPYLLGFADEHIIGGANMSVFIKRLPADSANQFATVRRGVVYKDPDTGELLGYEVIPSGEVEIKSFGNPAEGMLTASRREIIPGDLLLPPEAENFQANFYPHVPAQALDGKIISVYEGVSEITQYQIVALNRGSKQGLEPGHVLRIKQAPRTVTDPITHKSEQLPAVDSGLLMIFKAMPGISYGLVMTANRSVHLLDRVEKPEPGSIAR